jgi:hypothetical protein
MVDLFLHHEETADEALLWEGCLENGTAAKTKYDNGSIAWQCFVYKILRDHSKQMQLGMIMPRQLHK